MWILIVEQNRGSPKVFSEYTFKKDARYGEYVYRPYATIEKQPCRGDKEEYRAFLTNLILKYPGIELLPKQYEEIRNSTDD